MGIRAGTAQELASRRVIKQFTTTGATPATGISDSFEPSVDQRSSKRGYFNAAVYGSFTTATVVMEKTFDGGTTWIQAYDIFGVAVSFTAAGARQCLEFEPGVLYRLRCSVFTTVVTLYGRMSQ